MYRLMMQIVGLIVVISRKFLVFWFSLQGLDLAILAPAPVRLGYSSTLCFLFWSSPNQDYYLVNVPEKKHSDPLV